MLLLDCVIIFVSGFLVKNRLSVLSYVLILSILPLVCSMIMIHEIHFGNSDFLYYIAVMVLTEASSLSVWVSPAIYGEYKKLTCLCTL